MRGNFRVACACIQSTETPRISATRLGVKSFSNPDGRLQCSLSPALCLFAICPRPPSWWSSLLNISTPFRTEGIFLRRGANRLNRMFFIWLGIIIKRIGAIFLPNMNLDEVLTVVRDYDQYKK